MQQRSANLSKHSKSNLLITQWTSIPISWEIRMIFDHFASCTTGDKYVLDVAIPDLVCLETVQLCSEFVRDLTAIMESTPIGWLLIRQTFYLASSRLRTVTKALACYRSKSSRHDAGCITKESMLYYSVSYVLSHLHHAREEILFVTLSYNLSACAAVEI
ncbi:hypothetical protein H2248_012018 [Termitomyces sp. 'cryptogamus']|nr:hypothetical protein H2248_012018 [Termitomyces sp. 'cryptogamus']